MKYFPIKPKERLLWLSLLILLILFPIHLPVSKIEAKESTKKDSDRYLQLFMNVFGRVRNEYVDKEKTKVDKLIYGAISGMLKSLEDPHTGFLNKMRYEELNTETKGSFGGLGIEIQIRDERLIIIRPMEGTPAWEVGLKPGDRIIKIEGQSTVGITIEEAVQKLRGLKGTAVNITVYRDVEPDPLDFRIVRGDIKIKSVVFDKIDESDIGYIQIRKFSRSTYNDIKNALEDLKSRNLESLLVDLRNNPGGLLDSVCEVVDLFVEEGMIVSTKDRHGNIQRKYQASKGVALPTYVPMVILINQYSASASEIFAGALQDHGRAVLLGEKTFGKFSVQNLYNLDRKDHTGFKMTIAYYYLPSGRSLHEEGLEPDIQVPTEYFTPYERKMIRKLRAGHYIRDYVKEYKEKKSDEKSIPKLYEVLEANEINLTSRVIKNLVWREREGNKLRRSVYDSRFDKQLIEAIKLLKSHKIFSQSK